MLVLREQMVEAKTVAMDDHQMVSPETTEVTRGDLAFGADRVCLVALSE